MLIKNIPSTWIAPAVGLQKTRLSYHIYHSRAIYWCQLSVFSVKMFHSLQHISSISQTQDRAVSRSTLRTIGSSGISATDGVALEGSRPGFILFIRRPTLISWAFGLNIFRFNARQPFNLRAQEKSIFRNRDSTRHKFSKIRGPIRTCDDVCR
jgi:hypothetical protein